MHLVSPPTTQSLKLATGHSFLTYPFPTPLINSKLSVLFTKYPLNLCPPLFIPASPTVFLNQLWILTKKLLLPLGCPYSNLSVLGLSLYKSICPWAIPAQIQLPLGCPCTNPSVPGGCPCTNLPAPWLSLHKSICQKSPKCSK